MLCYVRYTLCIVRFPVMRFVYTVYAKFQHQIRLDIRTRFFESPSSIVSFRFSKKRGTRTCSFTHFPFSVQKISFQKQFSEVFRSRQYVLSQKRVFINSTYNFLRHHYGFELHTPYILYRRVMLRGTLRRLYSSFSKHHHRQRVSGNFL